MNEGKSVREETKDRRIDDSSHSQSKSAIRLYQKGNCLASKVFTFWDWKEFWWWNELQCCFSCSDKGSIIFLTYLTYICLVVKLLVTKLEIRFHKIDTKLPRN